MSGTRTRLRLNTSSALAVLLAALVLIGVLTFGRALAQEAESTGDSAGTDRPAAELDQRLREAGELAETALAQPADTQDAQANAEPAAQMPVPKEINLLELLIVRRTPDGSLRPRWLMLPIALMSLLVVAVGSERLLGLRRGKVLPSKLVAGLKQMASQPEAVDPRQAYRLSKRYRSTASTVIEAMLLKVGRPHMELENAINQASQREADRLHANVRWLNLAAAVTPLLGLLGTVWGMIQAFFQTANMPVEANRAQVLADGIWTALVTTFAGLSVAIPAAVMAHYFEGRIQKLFREMDETLFGLLRRLERYEGRIRLTKAKLDLERSDASSAATTAAKDAMQTKPAASR